MATKDELFDRYAIVKPEFDRLKKEMDALKAELRPLFKDKGEIITSSSGVQLRMDGRCQLNHEKFAEKIGKRFVAVSKRVAVAALVKAAILKGKVTQEEYDSCMEPTETWFKIL